ncbi:ankyrin repeat domain-containing protein [Candidatus Berkiella aquae]|uniref:Ankyrin repeat domain-containing protein n=1 Tax=Candidatus Berkiella aquae TaxID=295108 RepID=A0A0Q9YYA0_9GAMM|nr:ankyrin repeat domain-containing protein [Candidatus Berkiella aquae]MCS5710374.1 ankyrin repeat domain-containing protein [Candidatus Berkiella aquae]
MLLYAFGQRFNPAMDKLPPHSDDAISFALDRGSLELLQKIKQRGDSLESLVYGKTALMNATIEDNVASIALLESAGADVNFKNRRGETALHFAVRENKMAALARLLLVPQIDVKQKDKKNISAIDIAIKENNVDAFILLLPFYDASRAKDYLHIFLRRAIIAKNHALIQRLIALPGIDVATRINNESIMRTALRTKDVVTARLVMSARQMLGLPLSKVIVNFNYFDSIEKMTSFLSIKEPLTYLEAHSLCLPVVLAALAILEMEKQVTENERNKNLGHESAMDDKAVLEANHHFTEVVKPHFAEKFASFGNGSQEQLEKIEEAIRATILDSIQKKAVAQGDKTTIHFISKNRKNLIMAEPKAMKRSVAVLNQSSIEQAAWRGYNPFALVKAKWPNLYTKPQEKEVVFSTRASHQGGNLDNMKASEIVRERTAYYYLAVIDSTVGDEDTRQNRLVNFINWLADIRNAHGQDDPSCFPGYLTRIAQMGNFHPVAALPHNVKSILAEFFRAKVSQAFKEKMKHLSAQEQQPLLRSLVDLNQLTAKEIACNPGRYPLDLLKIRQDFISEFEDEIKLLEKIKQESHYPLDNEDLIYIQQHLVDITKGDIGLALEEMVRKASDRIPNADDLQTLNPFTDEQPVARDLLGQLLSVFYNMVPQYNHSFHQLEALAGYLTMKIPVFIDNPRTTWLEDLIDSLECEQEISPKFKQALMSLLVPFTAAGEKDDIENPFVAKMAQLNRQIENSKHPLIIVRLQKLLGAAQLKIDLFNHFLDYLQQKEFSERELLQKLIEEIVDYTILNNGFVPDNFQEERADEWGDAKLRAYLGEITPLFPESYQVQENRIVCKVH